MAGIYITPGQPTGGGSGGTSTDVDNTSTVPGATVTDALNNIQSGLSVAQTVQYIPNLPIQLTATDISNKYIVLQIAPTDKDKTQLFLVGGIASLYGTDFIVTNDDGGKRLTWAGLGLDGFLEANDTVIIIQN